MKILINGGCGFLGSNLAAYGIKNGYEITVLDNLMRIGAIENLKWLQSIGKFKFINTDTRFKEEIENIIEKGQYDAVFHLAGQVAMTTSIVDPYKDFSINTQGTLNVLEAIRKKSPHTAMFFSSTNKVYGDLEQFEYEENSKRYICLDYPNGFDENVPLNFRSPYGCSKGAADQYMLDYSKIYNLRTVVFRHSSMYGGRQFATYDQGWVGWFCEKAIENKFKINSEPFDISGNGKQVRDILHAEDMIQLYYTALKNIDCIYGNAYNIGGGVDQALSLLELFDLLNDVLDIKLEYRCQPPRVSDQKVFIANINKISSKINWRPKVKAVDGITKMIEWIIDKNKIAK